MLVAVAVEAVVAGSGGDNVAIGIEMLIRAAGEGGLGAVVAVGNGLLWMEQERH